MKIVDVCEFYSPTGGGVRRYINQKLELAARFGHQLTVIAPGAVTRVYTNLAVLDVTATGFAVRDMAPGLTFEALQEVTDAPLHRAA